MIEIIPAKRRHFSDYGWLKTYWLFSFSDYFDAHNTNLGALRVFNDDVVEPGTGFNSHKHDEMEIVTIVLEGAIVHKDSMGNETIIRSGDVQCMSAGTGITHSEYNQAGAPVHFYQIWIIPDETGLAPSYQQKTFDPAQWKNRLLPVASGQGFPDAAVLHTDAAIYRATLDEGVSVTHTAEHGRKVFLYLTEGHVTVNSRLLHENDQARLQVEEPLILSARKDSELILIDVPSSDIQE
ncbi:MAG TPA: pirin family protein [Verrucomicrobia bacterium]|nr:MAG: Pirin domain-containing protein [Lentisphaerae bacterium GWF2_57_35]HBA82612.1 pirin family protein [Verrucomicrobiota bacterium]